MSQDDSMRGGLEHPIAFETLLFDVSAKLISAPDAAFASAVQAALRDVVQYFGADRGGILAVGPDRHSAYLLHGWYAEWLTERVPGNVNLVELFPYGARLLIEEHRPFIVDRYDETPPEASRDRATHEAMGVKSTLNLPVVVGGQAAYIMNIDALQREVHWPPDQVPRLQVLGEILAGTIERRRVNDALRESEMRLLLAARSAGAGLWDLDVASGRIWATPDAKMLYGFAHDADVTIAMVLEAVHPDDVHIVSDRVTRVSALETEFLDEYRVVLPGGETRWLAVHGSARAGTDGSGEHLMGVSVDITARKQEEAARQLDAARLQAAIDLASLGCYEVSDGERVTHLDARCREIFGVPADSTEERAAMAFWMTHLHADEIGRMVDYHQRLNAGMLERATIDYRFLHPQRGVVWLHQVTEVLSRRPDGTASTTIGVVQDVTESKRAEESLARANADLQRLREQLERENTYLRQEASQLKGRVSMVGQSPAMRRALIEIEKVAPTDSTVLLMGETGSGKELVAAAIHNLSQRRGRTMVRVNCAAIPLTLIEAELFGRERGAYTGALSKQIGRFEMASGSTIFLDEIGDLPADIQIKLLRVIQERQIERLGSPRVIEVDLRIIAATNRDLAKEVREGRFREDLYYRLNVFPVRVPPLRERLEDLPLLVESLVGELGGRMGKRVEGVSRASMDRLRRYSWPGNVRELRNVLERAMILSAGPELDVDAPEFSGGEVPWSGPGGQAPLNREALLSMLQRTGWRIRGQGGAADLLGLKPTTLEARMARLGIKRP